MGSPVFKMEKDAIHFYLPFDYAYLNKTVSCMVSVVSSLPGVRVVGISDPPPKLPARIVIYMPFVFMGRSREAFHTALSRLRKAYTANLNHVNYDKAHEYYNDFLAARERADEGVAILNEYDLHALTHQDFVVQFAEERLDYLIFSGPELFDNTLHSAEPKKDLVPGEVAAGLEYLTQRLSRVISLPHTISPSEFVRTDAQSLTTKTRLVSVPGVGYTARNHANRVLAKYSLSSFGAAVFDRAYYATLRKVPVSTVRTRLLWRHFAQSIQRSHITMTCGSSAGYFVRKFIEIPAMGSCLCTFDYAFLSRVGFRAGVNFLPLNTVEDLGDYVVRARDPEFASQIAEYSAAGAHTVYNLHSTIARTQQLSQTLCQIAEGRFKGSFWSEGQYLFR